MAMAGVEDATDEEPCGLEQRGARFVTVRILRFWGNGDWSGLERGGMETRPPSRQMAPYAHIDLALGLERPALHLRADAEHRREGGPSPACYIKKARKKKGTRSGAACGCKGENIARNLAGIAKNMKLAREIARSSRGARLPRSILVQGAKLAIIFNGGQTTLSLDHAAQIEIRGPFFPSVPRLITLSCSAAYWLWLCGLLKQLAPRVKDFHCTVLLWTSIGSLNDADKDSGQREDRNTRMHHPCLNNTSTSGSSSILSSHKYITIFPSYTTLFRDLPYLSARILLPGRTSHTFNSPLSGAKRKLLIQAQARIVSASVPIRPRGSRAWATGLSECNSPGAEDAGGWG
ncbi:hypothetical protein FIBSPDRAFT_993783 [Athelia psychrophila]|uniref:Uncharacterized protein n=1 Tax=Athelia psychrophila TaxID=1759441 RepID=A0A165Y4M8_9AGAM|nr:hypothetical protein FIBSPDRAFT_993783 [Fibularhizoctonia sp. CBS 109695]